MNGFDRRKERLKKNIIKTSKTLFISKGYAKVSIQEISEKAQVSPMSIYNFFGNKESLLNAVLSEMMLNHYRNINSALVGTAPFKICVESYFLAQIKSQSNETVTFFKQSVQQFPLLYADYLSMENQTGKRLQQLILNGQKNKLITTQATATQLCTLINALAQSYAFHKEPKASYMPLKVLFQILWNGISPE